MSIEEEEVGELSGPSTTVNDETDGRTLDRFGVLVMILDDIGEGASLDGAEIVYEAPIPVYRDGGSRAVGDIVGSASPYVQDGKLFADIFLNYSTPERLGIEAGMKMIPCFDGLALDVEGNNVKKALMKGIVLGVRNADPRIPPL